MDEVVLAVDLGGTNIRMAAVSSTGAIRSRARAATPQNVSPSELTRLTLGLVTECQSSLMDTVKVKALGFASPAPAALDADGILGKLPNLPGLNGFNLRAALTEHLPYPVVLENDATAAAIGEHWLGVSKGFKHVIQVTLGTGVGGGLIINGDAYRGIDGTAGEIGHICVEPDGHPCGCGSRGCLEQCVSATAMVRMGRESGLPFKTSLEIYDAATNGNDTAQTLFFNAGRHLGIALAGLVNTLNPELIVLGGGMAGSWDLIIDTVEAEIRARAFEVPAYRVKLEQSMLGDDAGLIGAAHSAFDLIRKSV